MSHDDERDLERTLEEHRRRIFEAPTDAERKKAERELAEHVARPKQTDDLDKIAREFEIRLKRAASLPPGATPEQREAFAPFLERVATIPPHDQQEVIGWDLWTQHMVHFFFQYGVEPLCAQLGLKVFGLLSPPPEVFVAATADADDIERARKRRAFVEFVEADVIQVVGKAIEYFPEALSGRLGSVLDETLHEIALRAIDELAQELNTVGKEDVRRARALVLDQWTKIEKVRLGTPAHGGNRSKADLSQLKKHFDAHIEVVKEAFEDCRQALSSRSQAKRQSWREDIKRNFPQLAAHDDLITLLQPAEDWPYDLADICIQKQINPDPEDICLVLAARLCGAPPFRHRISTLRVYMRQQKAEFQD
jgi:hypothetical protein